jgi:hypothetical protein
VLQVTNEQPKRDAVLCAQDRIEETTVRIRCRSSSVRAKLAGRKYCGHVWEEEDVKEMRERAAKGNTTILCPNCALGHVVGGIPGRPGVWIGALL